MHTRTKTIILLVAVALAAGVAFGPTWINADASAAAQIAAQRALAVFVVCLALWLTHTIPLAITGLLAFGLLPLLGVTSAKGSFSHLGSEAVFFMLGVFVLTAAMISTGLSKRLTLLLLGKLDRTPRSLFSGVLVVSAMLALWMPEHAVAAMMFPIVLEVVEALRLKPNHSAYARLLFLGLAWGAVIGGVGTILGGARAPLAINLLRDFKGLEISFFRWMIAALPVVVILTAVALVLLPLVVRIDIQDVSRAAAMIRDGASHLGGVSPAEWRLAVLGLGTIAAWVAFGHHGYLTVISVVSACLLFMLRIVSWKQVQDYLNWGILLMYGGAIAIGSALHDTLAVQWLVDRVPWAALPPFWIVVAIAAAAVVLTESISNAATVAVLLPVGFAIGGDISPVVITLAVTIPAGLPFCLPMSSPPHAIAFSSGYYTMQHACKPGVIMDLAALFVFVLVMRIYWPIIGLGV